MLTAPEAQPSDEDTAPQSHRLRLGAACPQDISQNTNEKELPRACRRECFLLSNSLPHKKGACVKLMVGSFLVLRTPFLISDGAGLWQDVFSPVTSPGRRAGSYTDARLTAAVRLTRAPASGMRKGHPGFSLCSEGIFARCSIGGDLTLSLSRDAQV